MLCPSSSPCARLSALLVVASALGLAAPAGAAGGNREAQAKKALKQALDDDYLNTRFDDAEQKLRAALQGCAKACSKALRAKLHVALGSVLAGGKKELEDARDEFVEALVLDPRIEPSPDLLSTEVSFAYEQARKKLRLASGKAPPPDPTPAKKPPKADVEEEPEDRPERDPEGQAREDRSRATRTSRRRSPGRPITRAPPPEPARKNWITISFAPDFAYVSGQDVCTQQGQQGSHYACLRADGSRYVGTPTLGNGDNVNAGLTIATLRVMLGYDRLVHPNITLGVRLGFAFNGASGDGVSFLPLHAEGRVGFWPGHDPFVGRGVRPMIIVSGGVAQVDAKVNVQVLEDPSASGTGEPPSQTLAAYRQNGLGFAAATFGVQFAPSTRVALHLAARASVTFPSITAVISPEAGVSVGF